MSMNYQLVYGKNGHYIPVIDQVTPDARVTEVFLNIPVTETTKTNERENPRNTNTKQFRPFSIDLYNEILHRNLSTNQEEIQGNVTRFKLPISNQYETEINWKHKEEGIKNIGQRTEIKIKGQELTKTEIENSESLQTDKEQANEDVKNTARKIIIENLDKAVSIKTAKYINSESNTENVTQPTLMVIEQKQENQLNEKKDDSNDPKSFIANINLYELIDTKSEINKETVDDERKLFLLQEIEECIEQGTVKKKSRIFENKTKSKQIKGRQIEKYVGRKAFLLGSEMMQVIKRTAELKLSKYILKRFFAYLTNKMIALTRFILISHLDRSNKEKQSANLTKTHQDIIKKKKLSSADLVELVLGKPKDLTQRMDTVISEFHSKLNINKRSKVLDRRAKSVSRIEVSKSNEWLSEMDREDREKVKEEIKLATLAAAKRVLGRRRSYHNLTDIDNEKVDGLTYIAIVESHVYTNKNAIFEDYISRLKTQVNNVLEVTDVNEMVATEVEGSSYKFTRNQEEFQSKELCIDEGQRINYVASVTVEHKQVPISIEKDEKCAEFNKLTLNETNLSTDIQECEVSTTSALVEIENKSNVQEIVPIIEEVAETNVQRMVEVASKEDIADYTEATLLITELKEELPQTIEDKFADAQVLNKERISQSSEVYDEVNKKEVSYNVLEEKGTLITEKEKIIATINEALIYEQATVLPQIEIQSEIIAKSTTEETFLDAAFATSRGILKELTTETDIAVITEDVEIEKDSAIIKIETKEFANAQVVAIATARQTSEVFDEVQNVDITEITEELPAVKIEQENFAKPVIYGKDVSTQVSTVFDIVDEIENEHKQLFKNEKKEEIAITCTEIQEAIVQPISMSTAFDIYTKIEETEHLEREPIEVDQCSSSEAREDVIELYSICYAVLEDVTNMEEIGKLTIDIIELDVATSSLESDFNTALEQCISTVSDITIDIYVVDNFETTIIKEENATAFIEVDVYCNAQCVITELCQETNIPIEEVEIIVVNLPTSEIANMKEEDEIFVTVLPIATPSITQLDMILIEVNTFDNELYTEEKALYEEEKIYCYLSQAICTSIFNYIDIQLEECNLFEIDKILEELASIFIEQHELVNALSICTSLSNNITTNSFETGLLYEEKLQGETATSFVEENHYGTALRSCMGLSQDIEILLDKSNELKIEQFGEERTKMSTEPFVLERTLPLSTSILSQVKEDMYEAKKLVIDDIAKEEAKILVEVSKLTLVIAICVAAIEDIYEDLNECTSFNVDDINEETVTFIVEPLVLIRILPLCVSILENINISYNVSEDLEIEQLIVQNADSTLEVNNFDTILCISTGYSETIITKLDEVNSFNVDKVSEYQATEYLQAQLFFKALPKCTATIFVLNIPVFEVALLEFEIFEQKPVSVSLEIKEFRTAQAISHTILQQDNTVLSDVENSSMSFEMQEDYANLSCKDTQLNATYAVSSAISKQIDNKYDIVDNYKTNLQQEQVINYKIENRDLKMAQLVNNATVINEVVNLQVSEDKQSHNFVQETAVVKIEPKIKNVFIQEANVSYEGSEQAIKGLKKRNIKSASIVKDETDTITKETTILNNCASLKSLEIDELKKDGVTHEQVTIIEEPSQRTKDTVKIVRKKSNIKQEASNAKYHETNIQSNIDVREILGTMTNITEVEPIVEDLVEGSSINICETKESNEANVNICIHKAKAKRDENYQEMCYSLTLTEPQVLKKSESETDETLRIKRKKNLKQYHTEEFQEECNLVLDEDVTSDVIIQEIIDTDENNSIDMEIKKQSMDTSLKFTLQSKIHTEDVKRKSKEYASNQEESAALTIFRKEDIPVIEHYEEVNSRQVTGEHVGGIEIISSQSEFESKSTKDNKQRVTKISKTNAQSVKGIKKESKEEVSGNDLIDVEINACKSKIRTVEGSFEKSNIISSSLQESTTSVPQEFNSTVRNKSKSLSLKTAFKQEIESTKIIKSNESSPEIKSPTIPPTPLTDEYIFRLVAPLPKSRGTTPVPTEPSPITQNDQNIHNKNVVPNIESVAIETVVYNPPLPSSPTSPVRSPSYTKPGLNGGMKRMPRYFKPGLRGGSDRPQIPKEEIIEVRKIISTLTSDISETLKNIEKYKEIVQRLKQQKDEGESSTMIDDENTDKQTKPEDETKVAKEMETSEKTTDKSINEQQSKTEQSNPQTDDFEIKLNKEKAIKIDINDFTNKIEEARVKSYNIKELTTFEEVEKDDDNAGVVELAPDTADIQSVEKDFHIIEEDSEPETPETSTLIKIEINKETDKSEYSNDVTADEEKTADEEVARVLELTTDRNTIKEISPVNTSPSQIDTVKEAHVISLTRVLSSHMLREGLSPDCQKMIDKFENKVNVLEEKKERTWTTFLQKSTNLQTEKLGHFIDLQNKFDEQGPFTSVTERNEVRLPPAFKPRDFNSSPVPWQERALADTLGASNMKELTPGDEPKFFVAIPTESKNGVSKSTVIPLAAQGLVPSIETKEPEERDTEHTVDELIQEVVRRVESLNIGEGKARLKELLLNNIKNIADSSIPIEEQLNQMKNKLKALEEVPDVIKETLESVTEKLDLINKVRMCQN